MIGHYSQLAHQGIADPSRSMCNGGGGGGGDAKDTRYKNLDQLYGVQTQASQFMLDQAMPNVASTLGNSSSMVNEAMSGQLGNRVRNQADNDANAAMGTATEAMNQNLARYGINPNSGAFAGMARQNAVQGAANRVSAMNKAGQWVEDQKWNRNSGLFGQSTGMNNGAMAGLSSAGAGMSNLAGQQNSADQRNAAGYGQAGSAFASAMFKADGGAIEKNPIRMASGGDAWTAYKSANPVRSSVGGSSGGGRSGGLKQMLGGAAPQLLGASLKDVLKGGNSSMLKAGKGLYDYGKTAVSGVQEAQRLSEAADVARQAQALEEARQAADALSAAGGVADAGSAAGDVASGLSTLGDSVNTADAAFATADTVSAAADTTTGLASLGDSVNLIFANGGSVNKPGRKFALGGLAKAMSVDNMSVADDSAKSPTVAKMDSSDSMSVSKMGTQPTGSSKTETHAKPVAGNYGKTDGMGESSGGDPDGFGSESADNRHLAGKATMSTVGNLLLPKFGGMIGSGLAEVLHPVGEAVSRNVIMAGDKIGRALTGNSKVGGMVGAMHTDPIGAIFSGKYFAEGGDVARKDFKPGGDVQGAGTETSDDIPAWLSDGEVVHNADAVKLAGKDALLAINEAGLAMRKGKATPAEARSEMGRVMMERGKQLAGSDTPKPGVKLAGGGFLGGNLGIAMGAGVDEWNRQKANDRADKADLRADAADARQQETHTAQMDETKRRNAELAAAGKVWQEAQGVFQGGADTAAQKLLERFNANDPAMGYNDGHTATLKKTDKGYVVTRTGPDGKVADERIFTPQQVQQEHMRGVYSQLAAINPAYGEKLMSFLDGQIKEDTRKGERVEDVTHRDKREGVTDGHWDKNFTLQKQQVANSGFGNAIAQQRLNMEKENFQSGAGERQLKSTLSTLNLALLNAGTPEERAPIVEKINSLQSIAGMDKDAPSEVKLANSLVKYGVFPDVGSALKFTTSSKDMSPDALRAKVYTSALTANFGNAKKAQEVTGEAMKYLAPGAASKPAPQNITAADIAATAQKHGISEAEVKSRLGLK